MNNSNRQTRHVKVEEIDIVDSPINSSPSIECQFNTSALHNVKCSPLSLKVNLESLEFNTDLNISCQKTDTRKDFQISNDNSESRQTSSIGALCFGLKSPTFDTEDKKGSFQSDEISAISKTYFERMPLSGTSATSSMGEMKKAPVNESKSNEESEVGPPTEFEIDGNVSSNSRLDQTTRQENVTHLANMPPLYSNSITTPTLSIQFSPLLSFSEERISNSLIATHQLFGIEAVPESVQSLPNRTEASGETFDSEPNKISTMKNGSLHTSSTSSNSIRTTNHESDTNPELTYADNLLLNASQGRPTVSTPIKVEPIHMQNISEKKRKATNSCRSSRQPQKRFSVNFESKEVPGGDLFVSKRDGRVRLTTNLPRKVEAIDPLTGERAYVYASCSEASREMGINRTRMSRTCRGGGGQIGNLIYQYVEMSNDVDENKREHMIESQGSRPNMSIEARENEQDVIGSQGSHIRDVRSL